jgi:RNase_H superfamily
MINKKPKVLLYDIETSPNLAYVWGKWEQDVVAFKQEWYIITFSWKWLGEKQTHVLSLPDFKRYTKDKTDDKELVAALWKLFDEADIVIAHNGNSFDQKKSNARFIYHGFPPPAPYKQIDTKLVAKRYFNFNSNSLNDLGQYLQLGEKLKTGGFDLWLGCIAGEMKSWKLMCDYNKQDVILLEKVYLKLRGWDTQHPSVSLISGTNNNCPNCDSNTNTKRGYNYTKIHTYQSLQCSDCGRRYQGALIK